MKKIILIIVLTNFLYAESFICTQIGWKNRTYKINGTNSKEEIKKLPKLKLNITSSLIIAEMSGKKEIFSFTEIKYNSRMYWSKNNMYMRQSLKNKKVFLWDIRKNSQSITLIYVCK